LAWLSAASVTRPAAASDPAQVSSSGRLSSLWLSVLLLTTGAGVGQDKQPASDSPFRIGFSSATFGEVNENDAIAAVRVWAQSLARELGIAADPQPQILRSLADIATALTNQTVDCLNLTTEEYALLRNQVVLENLLVAIKGGLIAEEYVLLVHRDSRLERPADLRGHKLGMLQSARGSLASVWMENLLAREEINAVTNFFSQVTGAAKTSKVVLPVFFRQLDACVVTRSGFDLMVELNPQLGQQLKILSTSTPVVPVVFCFRADFNSPIRKKILGEISKWHTVPAGRQILTLFQCDSLEQQPETCLDSALEMLASHHHWQGCMNPPPRRAANGSEAPKGRAQP
jgi:ABC-type phosphate/phosphonate transport system substrate-binding protein